MSFIIETFFYGRQNNGTFIHIYRNVKSVFLSDCAKKSVMFFEYMYVCIFSWHAIYCSKDSNLKDVIRFVLIVRVALQILEFQNIKIENFIPNNYVPSIFFFKLSRGASK